MPNLGNVTAWKKFHLKLGEGVYKSYVRSVNLYGSEAWCLKESEMEIWQGTERTMCGAAMCGGALCGEALCGGGLCGGGLCGGALFGGALCGGGLCGVALCGGALFGGALCGGALCGGALCGVQLKGRKKGKDLMMMLGWKETIDQ